MAVELLANVTRAKNVALFLIMHVLREHTLLIAYTIPLLSSAVLPRVFELVLTCVRARWCCAASAAIATLV